MENIFDLQSDILNLIVKHNLENGEYAFIYRDGKMMIVDLSQISLPTESEDLQKEE